MWDWVDQGLREIDENGTFENTTERQKKMFSKAMKIRYFKITTKKEVNNKFFSSIAEIGVIF